MSQDLLPSIETTKQDSSTDSDTSYQEYLDTPDFSTGATAKQMYVTKQLLSH